MDCSAKYLNMYETCICFGFFYTEFSNGNSFFSLVQLDWSMLPFCKGVGVGGGRGASGEQLASL